jgi:hypothetical protein
VEGDSEFNNVTIYFKLSDTQKTELEALIQRIENPSDLLYHQWLSPDSYASRFGISNADLTAITSGRYTVVPANGTITLHIDRSSYPNQDNTTAVRPNELKGDELSWKVAARPDGSIPITVLRRVL